MVNILPPHPTFGTLLAQALGHAGQNIGQGLMQRNKLRSKQNLLENYAKNFNMQNVQGGPQQDLDNTIEAFRKQNSLEVPSLLTQENKPRQQVTEQLGDDFQANAENGMDDQQQESENKPDLIKEALTFTKPSPAFIPTDIKDFSKIAQMEQKERLSNEKNAQKKIEQIDESAKGAQRQLDSIRVQEKLIEDGKGGPVTWDNLMSKLGFRTWMSPSGQLFQSQLLNYMEGMRDLFGVRLTDADLKLVLDKLPDIGRNPQSNKQIMDLFKIGAQYNIARKNAKDLILSQAEKQGVFPKDLERRIDLITKETFEPYREQMIQNVENLSQQANQKSPGKQRDFPKGTVRTSKVTGKSQVWNGKEWVDRK